MQTAKHTDALVLAALAGVRDVVEVRVKEAPGRQRRYDVLVDADAGLAIEATRALGVNGEWFVSVYRGGDSLRFWTNQHPDDARWMRTLYKRPAAGGAS